MKHKAFFIFMTALLIGSPLYAQKYKIALIHSYQEGYSGAGIVNKLFVKGLKDQQIDFQLRTFYLDCEKYESVEEERRISEFADSIRSWGGDLIAVLDDQATYSVMACGNPYVRQVWGIERSVFLLVGENGRKTLKTNRFRHGMGNGQNISKRFPFT